jgi:hypothetical protein
LLLNEENNTLDVLIPVFGAIYLMNKWLLKIPIPQPQRGIIFPFEAILLAVKRHFSEIQIAGGKPYEKV